jgi:hypothetical protein
MNRIIRALVESDADLDAGDASETIELFHKVVTVPKHAKALRGCIVFQFGRFDSDPRPNFVIPEVRRYTQLIDEAHPYFCYFLPEPKEMTQVYSWLMSLASPVEPIAPNATGVKVNAGEYVDMIAERITAVRTLCNRIFDEPSVTEKAILDAVPKEAATAVAAKLAGTPLA